jgi:ribosome maturation factor RimP
MLRQYKKNVGRKIEVTFTDDSKMEGKLLSAEENGIQLESTTGKNKKAVTTVKEIGFAEIKQAKVLISF